VREEELWKNHNAGTIYSFTLRNEQVVDMIRCDRQWQSNSDEDSDESESESESEPEPEPEPEQPVPGGVPAEEPAVHNPDAPTHHGSEHSSDNEGDGPAWTTQAKNQMKGIIRHEENHRVPIKRHRDIWHSRFENVDTLKRLDQDWTSVLITNAGGVRGNHQTLGDLIQEAGGLDGVRTRIIQWEQALQTSKWKEKFVRYVFNKDHAQAEKYHGKLQERALADLEDQQESLQRGERVLVSISHRVNGGGEEYTEGEEGYRRICEEMQTAYDWRKGLLAQIAPED